MVLIILKCTIFLFFIINIMNFVQIIMTKNKKNIILNIVLLILTVPISYIFDRIMFDNFSNHSLLYSYVALFNLIINCGLIILSIIVGLFRYKKCTENTQNNIKSFLTMILILIIPIMLLKCEFLREENIIKNGEIIFIYDNHIGGFDIDYDIFVANEKGINPIELDYLLMSNYAERKYNIEHLHNSNDYQINKIGFNKILKDVKENHSNGEDIKDILIYKFKDCDYSVIEFDDVGELYKSSLLYKKDKYIGEIKGMTGYISDFYLINK